MLIQRNDIFEGNLVYFEKTIDKTNISWKYVSCQTFRNFVQFSAFAPPLDTFFFSFFLYFRSILERTIAREKTINHLCRGYDSRHRNLRSFVASLSQSQSSCTFLAPHLRPFFFGNERKGKERKGKKKEKKRKKSKGKKRNEKRKERKVKERKRKKRKERKRKKRKEKEMKEKKMK